MFIFYSAESGFRRVGPKEYHPRLLKFNDEVNVLINIMITFKMKLLPDVKFFSGKKLSFVGKKQG